MPPKKTAPPPPPAKAKRGTKRSAADADSQPSAKRTTSTRGASSSAAVAKSSSRSTVASLSNGRRTVTKPTYVPKKGMNPFPTALAPPEHGKCELFVFGNGDMGQHGLGTEVVDEIKRPRLHTWVQEQNATGKLGPHGLEKLAAGGMHTLAIDSTGRLLSWGINDNAALGRQTARHANIDSEVFETQPMQVEGLAPSAHGSRTGPLPDGGTDGAVEAFRATRIAAGDSISVALNEVGKLRIWGSFRSDDGPLGFDRLSSKLIEHAPTALPELVKHSFVDVACGDDHVLALATDGIVFAWGNGTQSQLGRRIMERHRKSGLTPQRVLGIRNIVSVAAGGYHSFAIDADGEVWGWGLNSFGQLGFEGTREAVSKPVIIEGLSPKVLSAKKEKVRVVQIDAGTHHSIFLLSDGRVFGAGRCGADELGLAEDHPAREDIQTEYETWLPIRQIEMQAELAARTIKLAAKKLLLITKYGTGQVPPHEMVESYDEVEPVLGAGPEPCVRRPVHIAFPPDSSDKPIRIASVACGSRHNLAVATDGSAYSWGFGPSSQLGQGDQDTVSKPTLLRSKQLMEYSVVAATAGGQHSALLAIKHIEEA